MKITLLSKHVVIETAPPETPDPDFSFPAGEDRTTKGVVRNVARDLDIKVKVGDTVLFRNRQTSDFTSNDTRYALVASSDVFAVVEQDQPEGDETDADGDERVVAHANPYRATGHDRPEADLKDLPTPDPSDEDTRPETDKDAEVSHANPVANPARSTAADRAAHHDDAKGKAADKGKDAEVKAPAHKTDKADHDDAKAKHGHGHGKAH